jgi:hypothetical protein
LLCRYYVCYVVGTDKIGDTHLLDLTVCR